MVVGYRRSISHKENFQVLTICGTASSINVRMHTKATSKKTANNGRCKQQEPAIKRASNTKPPIDFTSNYNERQCSAGYAVTGNEEMNRQQCGENKREDR